MTLLAPVAMTYFLVFATGARLLEQTMMQRPGYPEYAARTSMFVPLPPKRALSSGVRSRLLGLLLLRLLVALALLLGALAHLAEELLVLLRVGRGGAAGPVVLREGRRRAFVLAERPRPARLGSAEDEPGQACRSPRR